MFLTPTKTRSAVASRTLGMNGQDPYIDISNDDMASAIFSLPIENPVLDGFIDYNNDLAMRQIYRDMYYHDPICGTCVETYAMLPFGDFSLTGVPNREMLLKFLETCEALHTKTLLPVGTIDQLVDGAMTGALLFNKKRKIFDSYMPLNLDFVDVFPNPLWGKSPILDLKIDDDYRQVFKQKDARIEAALKEMPQVIQDAILKGGKVKLEPENTVYIPRLTRLGHKLTGVSLFRRLVPIWLVEKALIHGTIDQAHKRQRGITWVTAGDGDWVASPDEMNVLGSDIVKCDRDPRGAVLVTRPGVSISEFRSGGEFWKHTDVTDAYTGLKLKGMGYPEALINGELNVGSADSTMSVFNRQMRNHREGMTRSFLYDKVFPLTAIANDFEKEDVMMETSSDALSRTERDDRIAQLALHNGERVFRNSSGHLRAYADGSENKQFRGKSSTHYYTPTVNWHDAMKPEIQGEWLDLLDKVAKNVPVPLRTYIAAAGLTVGDLVASMDEDVELRETMAKHMKKIQKYMPTQTADQANDLLSGLTASASADRRTIADREDDYGELSERYLRKMNGGQPVLSRRGKAEFNDKANKIIAEAAVNIAARENRRLRRKQEGER